MSLIPADKAASILGVNKRQLSRDVQNGLLRQHYPTGASASPARPLYELEEVVAYADIKKRGLSFAEVAMLAYRSHLGNLRNERVLARLTNVMGIDLELIELTEENIRALHKAAEESYDSFMTPNEILRWARTFFMMGEEYFEAAQMYLDLEDPWDIYIRLAERVFMEAPYEALRQDPSLNDIYQTFSDARIVLRQAAFFYVRQHHGHTLAVRLFPDASGDMHDELVTSLKEAKRNKK
jgi:hypothetical protein